LEELAQILKSEQAVVEEGVKQLLEISKIVKLPDSPLIIHQNYISQLRQELQTLLERFHRQSPLKLGLAKELIRKKLPGKMGLKTYNAVLEMFMQEGWLTSTGEFLRHSQHQVRFSEEQQMIREKIECVYLQGAFNPPTFSEIMTALSKLTKEEQIKQVYQALLDQGVLIAVAEDLVFHAKIIEQGKSILQEKVEPEFTVAQFRDWVGSSRKYALPLLEYYDQKGITQRQGDKRILKEKK